MIMIRDLDMDDLRLWKDHEKELFSEQHIIEKKGSQITVIYPDKRGYTIIERNKKIK